MKHFLSSLFSFFHSPLTTPLLQQADAGGSGGTGTGTGGGTGAGSSGSASPSGGGQRGGGTGAAGSGSGGTGTGTGTAGGTGTGTGPFALSDDAQVRLADGRVVRYADHRAEIEAEISRDYQGRYSKGYELLLAEAKRIDALSRGRGGQGGRQSTQIDDPLADIRDKPIIAGADIARLYDMLQKQGLGPLANVVAQMQQGYTKMQQQLQQATQRFGSQDEDAQSQQFESRLDQVLAKVEVKGLNGNLDPKSPALRTFARNLYLSYVPSSWKAGEFEQQLGNELSELLQAVREMDRKAVFDGKEKLRQHFNPNRGGAKPSGDGKYKFETPREIAARAREAGMFGGGNSATNT